MQHRKLVEEKCKKWPDVSTIAESFQVPTFEMTKRQIHFLKVTLSCSPDLASQKSFNFCRHAPNGAQGDTSFSHHAEQGNDLLGTTRVTIFYEAGYLACSLVDYVTILHWRSKHINIERYFIVKEAVSIQAQETTSKGLFTLGQFSKGRLLNCSIVVLSILHPC